MKLKKFWILTLGISIFAIFCSLSGYAQDTTSITTREVYNDVKSVYPEIKSVVSNLAKELKVTADSVWNILVRQQLVKSIVYLIAMLLTIGSVFNFYYRMKQGAKDLNPNYSGECWKDSNIFLAVISCLLMITGIAFSIAHAEPMVTGFVNPEYGAIKQITELAMSLKGQ